MSTPSSSLTRTARTASPWRSLGLWLSGILIAYLFFNSFRALNDSALFAAYFGIPLTNPGDNAFVAVYAIRTFFMALFGLVLLIRRNYATLALYLLVATVMPIGDAVLVWQRDGAPSIIVRHIIITGVVLLTWFLTQRWVSRNSDDTAAG